METITIDYEYYKDLVNKASNWDNISKDLEYIINECDTIYNNELCLMDNTKMLCKKYKRINYNNRILILNIKEQEENRKLDKGDD